MSVRTVRLGEPRLPDEGVRIGTVRRPPRGVRKERYAADDWFDVWFPDLAPSSALMAQGKASSDVDEWARFAKAYRAEMSQPTPSRTLDLLAAFSHQSRFSVGCCCADESRCHRLILRELLAERGASFG